MAEKVKQLAHEKTIENIMSKNKNISSYTWALKHDHDTMISGTRSHFIDKMGADKAYEYLKTSEGQNEYSVIGSERLQDLALKRYGTSKDKVHEFDLTRLVEGTYGMDKSNLFNFANKLGPEFDFSHYKTNFLDKHLQQVGSSLMQNHLLDFDIKEIPSIVNHIGANKYFSDVNLLKDDKFKGSIAQAVINWDNGKNPVGSSYIKQDPNLSMFLKDTYKNAN